MPTNTTKKPACAHERKQRIVVGKVDRRFGREDEGVIVLLLPGDELGQERLYGLLVADEIVVDEIEVSAISAAIERIQFAKHLRRRLHARHAAIELDDVAELAVERAAAGELDGEVKIVAAPERDRSGAPEFW